MPTPDHVCHQEGRIASIETRVSSAVETISRIESTITAKFKDVEKCLKNIELHLASMAFADYKTFVKDSYREMTARLDEIEETKTRNSNNISWLGRWVAALWTVIAGILGIIWHTHGKG